MKNEITYDLHRIIDLHDKEKHFCKVYHNGKHIANTGRTDSEIQANQLGKQAIDHYNKPENRLKESINLMIVKGASEDTLAEETIDEMTSANMSAKDVHKHLKSKGWAIARTNGGHDVFSHPKSVSNIAVPRHKGDLSAPTVIAIMKKAKIQESEGVAMVEGDEKTMIADVIAMHEYMTNGHTEFENAALSALRKKHGDEYTNEVHSMAKKLYKEDINESPSECTANIMIGKRKAGHYLKRGDKYISDAHPSADAALAAWKGMSDNKGVRIVKESEEHPDEEEDLKLIKKVVKKSAIKNNVTEARDTHYHSVWYHAGDKDWKHHFDADNREDADAEKYSLKGNGEKVKILRVPKDQADWRKPEHREAAIKRLNEAVLSFAEFKDRIDAHKASGSKVKDSKYGPASSYITHVDKEGNVRKTIHSDSGTKVERLPAERVEKDDDEIVSRGRPSGSKSGANH